MKRPFFAKYALVILMAVFFLVPFALRGARKSLEGLKNDVKDWLPDTFAETRELEWFRNHFMGEQFILASWPGCTANDLRYKLFIEKLRAEVTLPAGAVPADTPAADDPTLSEEKRTQLAIAAEDRRARELGDQYGLCITANSYENWAGKNERWLKGDNVYIDENGEEVHKGERWFYILPNGELYRWNGSDSLPGAVWRSVEKSLNGHNSAEGELIATLGLNLPAEADEVGENRYYADPRRVTARLFKSVTSGPIAMNELTQVGGPLRLNEAASEDDAVDVALGRLTGTLFGPAPPAATTEEQADWKNRQTCVVVTLSDVAKRNLGRVCGRGMLGKPRGQLLFLAEECGISDNELKRGGPPVDNVAIDEEGSITLVRLLWLSLLVGVVISYFCYRSWRVTIMIFFCGGVSAVTSLALVYWCGSAPDAVLMSMPSLVYVLGLSCAVHVINYYKSAVEHGDLESAPTEALKHSWLPSFLCQLTGALGLLSLLTADLLPIRKFGIFASAGILVTLAIVFLYLPAALQLWPPGYHKKKAGQAANSFSAWWDDMLHRFFRRVCVNLLDHHKVVIAGILVITVCCAWGLGSLNTSIKLLEMFDKSAKIIHDYDWLEANLGRLVPMELVVAVNTDMQRAPASAETQTPVSQQRLQLSFLERMELAARVQKVVEDEFGASGRDVVGRAMSAVTFAPELPKAGGGFSKFAERSAYNRKLEERRGELLHTDYLREDQETKAELWRISLRLRAKTDVDYGLFVHTLENAVEPVLTAYQEREQVLRTLDESRGGAGFMNAKVLLLGAPLAAYEPLPASAVKPEGNSPPRELDQTQLFGSTLVDLLKNARLQLHAYDSGTHELRDLVSRSGSARGRKDMSTTPLADTPEWKERMAQYDAVVLLGPCDGAALAMIQDHAPGKLIDARGHTYQREEGSETARVAAANISAVYTGVVPVVYKAQRTLLDSLVESAMWSFLTIAPIMMLQLRSLAAGLISMVPNVFPILIVFGILGWIGVPVDIGSMMTASIALGIAVDDTIHFLTWYREGLLLGLSRREAILRAYDGVAPAMITTAIIAGVGLSVFMLSTFTPTQRFGTLMLTLMFTAMWGDLVLTPALLASPIGWIFGRTLAEKEARAQRRAARKGQRVDSSHLPLAPAGQGATPHSHKPHGVNVNPPDNRAA